MTRLPLESLSTETQFSRIAFSWGMKRFSLSCMTSGRSCPSKYIPFLLSVTLNPQMWSQLHIVPEKKKGDCQKINSTIMWTECNLIQHPFGCAFIVISPMSGYKQVAYFLHSSGLPLSQVLRLPSPQDQHRSCSFPLYLIKILLANRKIEKVPLFLLFSLT